MKILTFFLAIMLIAISVYGLITGDTRIATLYGLLTAGLLFIVMGITEYPQQKATAFTYFALSAVLLMIAVYSL